MDLSLSLLARRRMKAVPIWTIDEVHGAILVPDQTCLLQAVPREFVIGKAVRG
jgi:hypothetical protein